MKAATKRLPLLVLLGLGMLCATRAWTAPPAADDPGTALVKARDKQAVYVIRYGQFYHRYDHLLVPHARPRTPEVALDEGYSPCPECAPPGSTASFKKEPAGGAALAPYYRAYVAARADPSNTPMPVGAVGGGGGGAGGGGYGRGLLGGVGQGLGTATAISGAYQGAFVR